MKIKLNKINIKVLFVVLLLTLSFVSGGKVNACHVAWQNGAYCVAHDDSEIAAYNSTGHAASCSASQERSSPLLTPLSPFPGGQGKNILGFTTPAKDLSCNAPCESIGGTYVGSANIGVSNASSTTSKGACFCNREESDLPPCEEHCDPNDLMSGESCEPEGDPYVLSLYILDPERGWVDQYLPTKPNKPTDVQVTIRWKVDVPKGAPKIEKCVKSGDWSGEEENSMGVSNLGKVPLYVDNEFVLTCYAKNPYDYDGEAREVVKQSVRVKSRGTLLILGSNIGSTIVPFTDDFNELMKAGILSRYSAKETAAMIEGDYVGGDLSFYYIGEFVNIYLGGKVIGFTLSRISYFFGKIINNFIKFNVANESRLVTTGGITAIIDKVEKMMVGVSEDISGMTTEESLAFEKYLAKKVAETNTEYIMKGSRVMSGAEGEGIVDFIEEGSETTLHFHAISKVTPSGPLTKKQVEIGKEYLSAFTEKKMNLNRVPTEEEIIEEINYWIEKEGPEYVLNELGAEFDFAAMNTFQQSRFGIGTISAKVGNLEGKYVKHYWNNIPPLKIIESVLYPNYITLDIPGIGSEIYNTVGMDATWGGTGWAEFLIANSVR